MGAVKNWLMEQEEREYDEKLHEALARDDDVGFKEPMNKELVEVIEALKKKYDKGDKQ